jgi:hypothetical protein
LECPTPRERIPRELSGVTPWTIFLLFPPLLAHFGQIRNWSRHFNGALESEAIPAVKRDPTHPHPSHPSSPGITVVLPVRNEAKTLPRLLGDLAAGGVHPAEVIVVDDASDDGTAKAVGPSSQWPFPVRWMANPGSGKKAGLSAGMRAAETEWVVQVDADVRVQPGFLDAIGQHLARDGAASDMLLLPLRLADTATGAPMRTFDLLQALDFAAMQGWAVAAVRRGRPAMASGGAWIWRQSAFPYDHLRPELASGDDVFSLAALIERGDGRRVGWCGHPETMASAAPMPTFGALLDQRIRWGAKSAAYPKALSEARKVATVIAAVHIAGLALLVTQPAAGLLFWAAKALGDMAYTHGVARAYGLFDGMGAAKRWSTLALLALVHPPFIITTLLLMPFRTARWKGRKAP